MEFCFETTDGRRQYPADFDRLWTLLFYYSGDFLPVSATELLGLAELQEEFALQGCRLLCVSADSVAVHLAFLENLDRHRKTPLRFPLGTADLQQVMDLDPDKKYIWLLAPGGRAMAHFSYPHRVGVNFTEILRTLRALKQPHPTPYGWVPGAQRLLPPPGTRDEARHFMHAQEQAGHIAVDWYLCFETPGDDPH